MTAPLRVYGISAACWKRQFAVYTRDPQRAVRVAERWARLFWPRYVRHLRANHPGSIAVAVADNWYGDAPPALRVCASPPLDSAGIIGSAPWECVYERVLPAISADRPLACPHCKSRRIAPFADTVECYDCGLLASEARFGEMAR